MKYLRKLVVSAKGPGSEQLNGRTKKSKAFVARDRLIDDNGIENLREQDRKFLKNLS
jgi:hypothetical protein